MSCRAGELAGAQRHPGSAPRRIAAGRVKNGDEKPLRGKIPKQLLCNVNDVFSFSPRGKLQSFMSQLTLYKLF